MDNLCKSIKHSDVDEVRRLVNEDKVNPNKLHKFGERWITPLLLACEMQLLDIVEVLLTNPVHPADVNMEDKRGIRPIWIAVDDLNSSLVRVIRDKATMKLDVNCTIETRHLKYGDRLHTERCNSRLFGHLCHCGTHDQRYTPLNVAVQRNNIALVRELIKAGADITSQKLIAEGKISKSPLQKALESSSHGDIIRLLIRNRSDVNNSRWDRYVFPDYMTHAAISPMGQAYLSGRCEAIDILMRHGYKLCFSEGKEYKEELFVLASTTLFQSSVTRLIQWGIDFKHYGNICYFKEAVSSNFGFMYPLAYIIMEIHPECIQESWFETNIFSEYIQSQLSDPVYNDPVKEYVNLFLVWLQEERRQPRSLQALCKVNVLQKLFAMARQRNQEEQRMSVFPSQPYIPALISELPLPSPVKDYLQITSLADAQAQVDSICGTAY